LVRIIQIESDKWLTIRLYKENEITSTNQEVVVRAWDL